MSRKKLYIKFMIRKMLAWIVQTIRVRLARMKGYDIHPSVILERKLHLDRLFPAGIHIDKHCLIASGVTILSHDHCKRVDGQPLLLETFIGKRCFVAVNATILPGVHIGDEVIVGAGAVVSRDVPSNVIVAGNPAKIVRQNIRMNDRAELINWHEGKWEE
jgi:acetyltransferase-like isoleucine patch superfamily enzyme